MMMIMMKTEPMMISALTVCTVLYAAACGFVFSGELTHHLFPFFFLALLIWIGAVLILISTKQKRCGFSSWKVSMGS